MTSLHQSCKDFEHANPHLADILYLDPTNHGKVNTGYAYSIQSGRFFPGRKKHVSKSNNTPQ